MIKQVICINWGERYGPPFINRLYASVARNITPPFSFTCFTDNPTGIRPEVCCEELPPLPIALPATSRGTWGKARLWNEHLGALKGYVLFLDLDLIITGNLDELFAFGNPGDVILARNSAKPLQRLGQTSVYRFPVGKLLPLLHRFAANAAEIAEKYRFEQHFVSREAPGGIKFFPSRWIRHFRAHCRRTFPLNYFLPPRLPRGARVVIFLGGLHPSHAIAGQYGVNRKISRREHLLRLFSNERKTGSLTHLRRYIRPTPWVAEYWRE